MKKMYLLFMMLCIAGFSYGQKVYSESDNAYYDPAPKIIETLVANGFTVDGEEIIYAGTQENTFFGDRTRGYFFQAQSNFRITGLMSAEEGNPGALNQSVEIVSFGALPPLGFPTEGSPYTTLFSAINVPAGWVDCDVEIVTGTYYGILGAKHDVGGTTMYNSYASPQNLLIDGNPTYCDRLLIQYPLSAGSPPQGSYMSEAGGYIGRVHMKINDGVQAYCKPATIYLDENGEATLAFDDIDDGTSAPAHNGEDVIWSLSQTDFTCADLVSSPIEVEFTVETPDASASCNALVTVLDEIAPVISCPGKQTISTDIGLCSATVDLSDVMFAPEVTENCTYTMEYRVRENLGGGNFGAWLSAWTDKPNVTLNKGIYQVRLRAVDGSGNISNTCNFSLTVEDNEAPVFEGCPESAIVQTNDAGECGAIVTWDITLTDNCPEAEITSSSHESGDVFPVGTTTVTLNAVDASGNSAMCTFEVTVNDEEAPVIAGCSQVQQPKETGLFITESIGTPKFIGPQNNTSGAQNYYDQLKTLASQFVTTATAGNALVYIDYSIAADGVIDALNNQGYTVTFAGDWGDFNTQLASGTFDLAVAMQQNWYTSFDVPTAQTYITNGGKMIFATWVSDATSEAALFEASFTGSSNCSSITITDPDLSDGITNPVLLSNPGWGIYNLGLSPIGEGEVLATNDCNGDAAIIRGNSGQTIMLGYLSDTPPAGERQLLFENLIESINSNPLDIIVSNDPGECGAVVNFDYKLTEVTDNCEVDTVTASPESGSFFPVGETTVWLTASDIHGNYTSCSFTVTVNDTELPTITCPEDMTVDTDPGFCNAYLEIGWAEAADNCGVDTVYNDAPADSIFVKGVNIVTWTVVDIHGNIATCEQTITVEDNEAPVIGACGKTYIVELKPVTYQKTTVYRGTLPQAKIKNLISDNCDVVGNGLTVVFSQTTFTPADWGTNTETVIATDSEGNADTCTITVVVRYPLKSGQIGDDEATDEPDLTSLSMYAYPNPTTGRVMLELYNYKNPDVSVQVMNITGQKVFEQKYQTQGWIELDLTGNKSGLYFINVNVDNQRFVEKILLKEQ